jgi:hypothetical protein
MSLVSLSLARGRSSRVLQSQSVSQSILEKYFKFKAEVIESMQLEISIS